uniref:Uncharacterized protein n=1 Tax=Timema douglasi TaxID=61478 RepID=A0A7R8VY99_TIMDO|nr:unnamed protein product [Timema douglasi]
MTAVLSIPVPLRHNPLPVMATTSLQPLLL